MSAAKSTSCVGFSVNLKPSTGSYCELCEIYLNSENDLKLHLSWKAHIKVLKSFNKNNYVPEKLQIPKRQITAQSSLVNALRDLPGSEPIVGLSSIYEYVAKMTKIVEYWCLMCNCKATTRTMVDHILGNKHRLQYLELYHNSQYVRVKKKNKSLLRPQLKKLCKEVEQIFGREKSLFGPAGQGTPLFGQVGQGTPMFGPAGQGPSLFGPAGQGTPLFGPAGQGTHLFGLVGQRTPLFGPAGQGTPLFDPAGQGTPLFDPAGQGTPLFGPLAGQGTSVFGPVGQETPLFGPAGQGTHLFGPVGQGTWIQSNVPFDNQEDIELNNVTLFPPQMVSKEISHSDHMSDFVEKPQSCTVLDVTVKKSSHDAVDSVATVRPNDQRPKDVQSQAELLDKPSGMKSGTEQIPGLSGNSVTRKVLNKDKKRLSNSNTSPDLDFTTSSETDMLKFDKHELQPHHKGMADKTIESANKSEKHPLQKNTQLSKKAPCSEADHINRVSEDSKMVATSKPSKNIESVFLSVVKAQTVVKLKEELLKKYRQQGMDLTSANQKLVERLELLSSYTQHQVPFDLAVQRVRDGDERDVLLLEYERLTLSPEVIESRIDKRVVLMKQHLASGTEHIEAAYRALDSEVEKDFIGEFEALGLTSGQAQKLAQRRIRMLEYLARKGWTVEEAAQKVLALETQQRKVVRLAQEQPCPLSQGTGKKECMGYVMMTLRILGFTHKEQVEQLQEAVRAIKQCEADKNKQKEMLINIVVTFPTFPSSSQMASRMAECASSKQASDNASTDIDVARDTLETDGLVSHSADSSYEHLHGCNVTDNPIVAEQQIMSPESSQELEGFTRISDLGGVRTHSPLTGCAKVQTLHQLPEGKNNKINESKRREERFSAKDRSPCGKRSRSREGSKDKEGGVNSEVRTKDRSPCRKRKKVEAELEQEIWIDLTLPEVDS